MSNLAIYTEQFKVAETLKNYSKTVLTFKLKPYKRKNRERITCTHKRSDIAQRRKTYLQATYYYRGAWRYHAKEKRCGLAYFDSSRRLYHGGLEMMSVFKGTLPQSNKMNGNPIPDVPGAASRE